MKESHVQQAVRLALSRAGVVAFRNNVGQCTTDDGRVIRYGVCNPGGSDLLGWTPVTVTPDMVGRTVAIFTAIECKGPRGKPSDAQLTFIDAVQRAGGFAGIARSPEEAVEIVQV